MKSLYCIISLSTLGLSVGSAQQEDFNSSKLLDFFSEGTSRVDVDGDALRSESGEIIVTSASVAYEIASGQWILGGSVGETYLSIDYDPNQTTNPTSRNEETQEASLSIEREWNENFSTTISGSYYDGFTDFRSLWISEFFLQSFGLFPQYEEADPHGWSVSLGNTWNYNDGLGRLSVDLGFSRDTIAQGWEIAGPRFRQTEGSREVLETLSGSVVWETTLNGYTKTQQTLRLSEVTARQLRVQYQTNWAFALSEKATLRAEAGGAYERPDFEAYFGGLALVYQVLPSLQLSVAGRLYSDTGEITSSNFNSAAPGLNSSELSVSALWTNGQTSVRGSLGFYDTNFDPSGVENIAFANLYADRQFLSARVALSTEF